MNKIAVTGAHGCIGQRLCSLGAEPLSCDVTNKWQVEAELHRVNPDLVIHCAAISSVDECEKDEDKAVQVNVRGTNVVCEAVSEILGDGKVVLMSTDQIFDGRKGNYKESAEYNPVHVYGMTKAFAEGVVRLYDGKVLRISRCFDSESVDISEYILRLENNIEIEVPNFIFRSYCHTDYIAEGIWAYAQRFDEMPEVLNLAGAYPVSFYRFMLLVADEYGYDMDLINPRGERSGFAPRPHKCGLNVSLAKKLGLPIYIPTESIQRMKCESKITL